MMKTRLLITVVVLFALNAPEQLQAQTLELIRKILVDPVGTLGSVDGCEFSKDGKLVTASDNHGVCRVYRV